MITAVKISPNMWKLIDGKTGYFSRPITEQEKDLLMKKYNEGV